MKKPICYGHMDKDIVRGCYDCPHNEACYHETFKEYID